MIKNIIYRYKRKPKWLKTLNLCIALVTMTIVSFIAGMVISLTPEHSYELIMKTKSNVDYYLSEPNHDVSDIISNIVESFDAHSHKNITYAHYEINYYVDTNNETYIKAINESVSELNALGLFELRNVSDKSQADIVVTEIYDSKVGYAGICEDESDYISRYKLFSTIKINNYAINNKELNYDYTRIKNTFLHEFGHALGLSHADQNEVSMMIPAGSFYGLEPKDIRHLQQLYARNVDK